MEERDGRDAGFWYHSGVQVIPQLCFGVCADCWNCMQA